MKYEQCNKSFRDINVLLRHIQIFHSLEDSYACVYDNCFRKFQTVPMLKKHLLRCFEKTKSERNLDIRRIEDSSDKMNNQFSKSEDLSKVSYDEKRVINVIKVYK